MKLALHRDKRKTDPDFERSNVDFLRFILYLNSSSYFTRNVGKKHAMSNHFYHFNLFSTNFIHSLLTLLGYKLLWSRSEIRSTEPDEVSHIYFLSKMFLNFNLIIEYVRFDIIEPILYWTWLKWVHATLTKKMTKGEEGLSQRGISVKFQLLSLSFCILLTSKCHCSSR